MSCHDALSHSYFTVQQHPLYLHAPVSSGLPSGLPPNPVMYDPVAQAQAQAHAAFSQQTAYLYQQQQQQQQAAQAQAQAQAHVAAAHGMHPQHHLQHGAPQMPSAMPPAAPGHGYMPPNPYMNMQYQKR